MLKSLKDIERYKVSATDGDIGNVSNFLLDDERWVVRYLVVQTAGPFFLDGSQVLISPISFREVEWSTQRFHLALTMDKIKHSPSVDTDLPVSRQRERDYSSYYGYPFYWEYASIWGMGLVPALLATTKPVETPAEYLAKAADDIHLRSAKEVRGYHVQGRDEAIGHIEDFIVDDETWEVHYLVIDTSNWWFGKKVLVSPHWAIRISWEEKMVFVDLARQTIKNCPEWDAVAAIDRGYESLLYKHYGRPAYWESDDRSVAAPSPRHLENRPG
jgi:sporulation protein YlmC with PRC-barrel domain